MIARIGPEAGPDTIVAELEENGVVIVENFLSEAEVDQVLQELDEAFARIPISGDRFTGRRSQVINTAVKRSATYRQALVSDLFYNSVDQVLKDNCHSWRLGASSVMNVFDGGELQILHRDEDQYEFVHRAPDAPNYSLSSIIALTDFTPQNGATRFVPGSHRWPLERQADETQTIQATMPKGSIAFWLGSTLHGLGVNTTKEPRTGIISISTVGWLRQEENFYVSVPQEEAQNYPARLQQMLGWQIHGMLTGFIPGRDPMKQLYRSG